ncbi:inositol monophosphatase [Pleomorphomonas sp. JP5]|uniref:inositol monophosphatase family protein n=1 Tax=Pleomorphomonas sp. JP5 TaxID=2942998 RepID=UPI0020439456|nr:inositol monophosphatase [Pleomorphomonas sp. JP5]MCM5556677.1 inositol monophosphatase [Pleomorphomonas sp. JP5]
MTVTRQDIDFLVATAQAAAEIEIMPHFSNLTAADIKTKAHASDFVTVADIASEALIEKRVRAAWGDDFLFVGEEVMEREPTLIDRLMAAPRAVVVDPIDGTFNYANGVPAFAVIISIVEHGAVKGGIIYDPVRNDAACAIDGGGAFLVRQGQPDRPLHVAPAAPLSEMQGCAGWYYASPEERERLLGGFGRTWGIMNYRCGGQEMRLLVDGRIQFCYYHKLSPWDHAAGWLIHREAGGYSALLDGSPYRPDLRAGGLLMAPDKASWTELATALSG